MLALDYREINYFMLLVIPRGQSIAPRTGAWNDDSVPLKRSVGSSICDETYVVSSNFTAAGLGRPGWVNDSGRVVVVLYIWNQRQESGPETTITLKGKEGRNTWCHSMPTGGEKCSRLLSAVGLINLVCRLSSE